MVDDANILSSSTKTAIENLNAQLTPHQFALVARGDVFGDDVEAAVAVDQVHDGHGPDQEDQDFARVAQLVHQDVYKRQMEYSVFGPWRRASNVFY